MRHSASTPADQDSASEVEQEPQPQGPKVQNANTLTAELLLQRDDPKQVARELLKTPEQLDERLAEVERKHGAAFAEEVRAHLTGWHGRPFRDKRVSYVGDEGGYLSVGRLGRNEFTESSDFVRFGTGQDATDLHGSIDNRGVHAFRGLNEEGDYLSAELTRDGRSALSRPYDRLYADDRRFGVSGSYVDQSESGEFRAGGTIRDVDNFDLDASWYARTGDHLSERRSLGLTDRDGHLALRGAMEDRRGNDTQRLAGYLGNYDDFGLEYERQWNHGEDHQRSWHAGFRQDGSAGTVYGGFERRDPGFVFSGRGEYTNGHDYSAELRANTWSDTWSLGGSITTFSDEDRGRSQALRVDAALAMGQHFLARGYAGLQDDHFLDEPAYRAGYGGLGISLTHRDRMELTAKGLVDTEGNWKAGLEVGWFKSRIQNMGNFTSGQQSYLFRLFVGARGGDMNAFGGGMADNNSPVGGLDDGMGGGGFFVEMGIGGT